MMGTKHAMHMDIRAITAYHPAHAHALTLTRAAAPTGVRATMPIEREPGARLRARTAPCSEAGTTPARPAWRAARLAQSVNPSLRAVPAPSPSWACLLFLSVSFSLFLSLLAYRPRYLLRVL